MTGMMFVKMFVLLMPSSLMDTVMKMNAREEPRGAYVDITYVECILHTTRG